MLLKRLFACLLGVISFCSLYAQTNFQKGILDLRNWDFAQNPIVLIEGDAYFEYGKFLTYKSIQSLQKPHFSKIPSYWNDTQWDDMPTKEHGFGTYYFQILLPKNRPENLAFYIPDQISAYRLYLNGKKYLETGKVDTLAEKNKIQTLPKLLELPTADTLHVVFEVAQFMLREGGLPAAIQLGETQALRTKREKAILFDVFLIGATFIMAFYHFGLFLLRKKDKNSFIFALICLITLVRTSVTGEQLFAQLYPEFSWYAQLLKIVAYITFYGILAAFCTFVHGVFPKDISLIVLRIIQIVSGICILATVFLPIQLSNYLIPFYQIFTLFVVPYFLVMVFMIAFRKREGSLIMLAGILIVSLAGINDILFFEVVFGKTILLFGIGVFFFLFLQAILLASRFTSAFGQIENLSDELKNLNQNLEQKVEQRTQEIKQKNSELNMTVEELNSTLDIVNNQKREIELQQDNLLLAQQQIQEKNRNIMGSIQYAKRIQATMLPTDEQIGTFFTNFFIFYRPKDIVSGDFYWFNQISEHKSIVVLADCTGHGVPGALMSMLGIEILNRSINDKRIHQPAQILTSLHQNIRRTLRQEHSDNTEGMEMGLLLVDKAVRQITYAGAMNPMYGVDKGELIELKATKKSIGGHLNNEKKVFEEQTIQLPNHKVMLYLCSDGYQDQFGGQKDTKFMTKNLKNLFLKIAYFEMEIQKNILENTLDQWIQEADEKQTDDITIFGICL